MLMSRVSAVAVMVCKDIEPVVQVTPLKPFGLLTSNPLGNSSVKPTPVKEVALGLVNVKVSWLVLPVEMGEVAKAFISVGSSSGRGQPVITTLSRAISANGLPFFLPHALTTKFVELEPFADVVI